jgi:hypothetical protein
MFELCGASLQLNRQIIVLQTDGHYETTRGLGSKTLALSIPEHTTLQCFCNTYLPHTQLAFIQNQTRIPSSSFSSTREASCMLPLRSTTYIHFPTDTLRIQSSARPKRRKISIRNRRVLERMRYVGQRTSDRIKIIKFLESPITAYT